MDETRQARVKGDEIDDAIDHAVREIMRSDAPAGLRARVMRRLDAPEPGRPWPMPWVAATAMLALGVAFAVLVVRGRAPVAAPAGTPVTVNTPAATPAPRPEPPPSAPAGRVAVVENRPLETRRSLAPSAVPPVDDRLVSAMSIDDGGFGPMMTPLAAIAPVGPAALALPASETRIGEIAVRPLEIDPIRIDPLSSTPR